eukprot:gene14695-10508_t
MDHQDQEVPPEPSFSDLNHEPPRQMYFHSEEEMMREFNALPALFREASVAGGLTKLAAAIQESNRDHNSLQSRMLDSLDQILAFAATLPNQPTAPTASFPAVDPNPPAPVQAPRARTQPLQTPVEAPQPTGVQPPEFTFQALGRLDAANIGTLRLTRRASSLEDQDPMMLLAGSASDTSFTAQTPPVPPAQRTPPARNAQQLPTPLVTPVLDTSGVPPSASRHESDPELPPDEFDEPFFDTDFSPLPNLDADAVDDATLYNSYDDRLSSAEFSDPAIPLDEHPSSFSKTSGFETPQSTADFDGPGSRGSPILSPFHSGPTFSTI